MPKLLLLGLCLFACTLPAPLIVWAVSTRWREAFRAWVSFSAWLGGLLLIAFLVWLLMPVPT